MNYKELEAKLAQATESTFLGNYEVAEQLTNDVLAALRNPTQAEGFSETLYPFWEGLDWVLVLRAQATLELATIAHRRGSRDVSLALASEVLAQADEWNLLPLQQKTWNLFGLVHSDLGNYDAALEYYTKVLSADKNLGDEIIVVRSIGNIGIVYSRLSDFPRALEYYEEALAANQALGDKRMIGGTKVNMGKVYLQLNNYEKALQCFNEGLAIFDELGERPFKLVAMSCIGMLYSMMENYSLALEQSQKVLAAYEELGAKGGIASCMGNIGSSYARLGTYDLALEYLGKALAMQEELGSKAEIAQSLVNIGNVYRVLGEYDRAMEYFLRVLALWEELGRKTSIANTFADIGHVYSIPEYEGFDAAKAEEFLLKAIAMNTEIGHHVYLADEHRVLSEFYERQKRDAEALAHYKKYIEFQKKVLNEEAMKTAEKYKQEREIAEREKEIAIAKATAEAEMNATTTLLHKVLPPSIAARLIKGEKVADYFPTVSILFADIAGFTPISSEMPAYIVVRFLNHIFGEFDKIMKKHGCEKIKTIGDGYMAIAGAPITCEDHAERLTAAAIEMQQTIILPEEFREYLPEGSTFGIRIGLHTGGVIAGVIGDERFVWDVYSDAVNIAARMESHGAEDKIHVTQDFVRHLQNRFSSANNTTHGLKFEKRGEMEIKGKGMMKTYYLQKANL